MSLTVAAIVNEPSPVIERFVGWYLAQGADRIILFFDNPVDPVIARFADHPRVTPIACTEDFWRGIGINPDARFTRRQNAALTHAYAGLAEGWLLNVDADELMYLPGRSLADVTASLPAAVNTLRVATAEQVMTEEPGLHFRLQLPRADVAEVYGADADLFRRRFGLIGHADGKSFLRAGMGDIRLRQHWAETLAGDEITGLRWGAAENAYLLHFFAPGYTAWRAKVEWRLGSHGFPEPIKERLRAVAESADPEAGYRRLHDSLHCLTAAQVAALRQSNGLLDLPADFAKVVA